jgi:chemotaxis protein histidine kinase CheA
MENSSQSFDYYILLSQIDPSLLEDFILEARSALETIDSLFDNNDFIKNPDQNLSQISELVHNMKGNAALLGLNFFSKIAHKVEDEINSLLPEKTHCEIKSSNIQNIQIPRQSIEKLDKLINNIKKYLKDNPDLSQDEPDKNKNIRLLDTIRESIQKFCKENNKDIEFDYHNFDLDAVPAKYSTTFKDIIVHLIRNSLLHGIETREERTSLGKKSGGIIQLILVPSRTAFEFIIRDDGRGLQLDKLKAKAIESELINKNEIADWNDSQIAELIFLPGITTSPDISLTAGRGWGMDIIRKKIEKYSGNIKITHKKDEYCQFRISLPL